MKIGVLPQAVTLTREWKTTWVTGLKTGGWRRVLEQRVEKTKADCSCLAQSVVTNYTMYQ